MTTYFVKSFTCNEVLHHHSLPRHQARSRYLWVRIKSFILYFFFIAESTVQSLHKSYHLPYHLRQKKKKGAKVSAKIARLIISLYKLRLIMIVKLAVERGISLRWFSNSNSFHGPSLGPDLWDWVHLALASVLPMSWLLFHRLSRVSAAVPKGTCEKEVMQPQRYVRAAWKH